MSQLEAVNEEVNRLPYKSDADRYRVPEFWASIDADGGDCEDYAIGKLNRLVVLGWPVAFLRLAMCFAETGEHHAVLIASLVQGDYMLDNRQPRVVPVADVVPVLGYRPESIQSRGGSREWVEWRGAVKPS